MASAAARAVPSSPRQTMADPSPPASCAGRGTSESARALIDGITHALGAEATEAAAAGEDRTAQVLVNLLADALDALDALGDEATVGLRARGAAHAARRNAAQRAWRRRHPEKNREYERRWKERLRADPERLEAYLADQRITYKLRREAKGLPVRDHGQVNATGRWRASSGKSSPLPIEPLALWLERVVALDPRMPEELAAAMQVHERALSRVLRREHGSVTAGTADALVWGYGKAVQMPDAATLAALLKKRCYDMPGNGTRLLRYLDLGEQVAHLAGAVVDRVDDLWPELAESG
jgi:hypothetical protein